MLCVHDQQLERGGRPGERIAVAVGTDDLRPHRPVLRALRDRPGCGPQSGVRLRRRAPGRPARLLPPLGRGPRRTVRRFGQSGAHPGDGTLRPRQLGPPPRQHALPLRLRRADRGTDGPRPVHPLLPGLRLSRAAGLRGRQRRLRAVPGRRVRGDLGGPRSVSVPVPGREGHKPAALPLLPPPPLPGLGRAALLGGPAVAGGGTGLARSGGGVSGAPGGLRPGLHLRVGPIQPCH